MTRYLPLALRAYAECEPAREPGAGSARPSAYSLVIDCETTTHLDQELRFGFYRVYNGAELEESGAFSGILPPAELDVLQDYCKKNGIEYLTLYEFVTRVFYEVGYKLHASIIGFNLPFDLSRLASSWTESRGTMAGGWTFFLAEDNSDTPPVQIRSLSHHRALIRFRMPKRGTYGSRSMKNRNLEVKGYRGHFVDVHTFAHALLGSSFTLDRLCETLGVKHPKLKAPAHGKVTPAYLKYAERDVLATWECYVALKEQLHRSGLRVEPSALYSEAGIAKSILRQMNVKPWRLAQPDFPPELLGIIWSTYYAGRSELRLRREARECATLDFTSQYPTVAILLNVWRFLTASGVKWADAEAGRVQAFIEQVTLEQLLQPETWAKYLTTLVQLQPDHDILPARAPYAQGDETIGENEVTSEQPIWYTMAAAIASKLRTGKAPKVLRAIVFLPGEQQGELKPIRLFGAEIAPEDDVYKVLINHRHQLREQGKEHEQLAVKLAANSLAAGIFGEVNVTQEEEPFRVRVHANGEQLWVTNRHRETPGTYYHPLLATFVTSGARLLLAMVETCAQERGLDWAMCDTDSATLVWSDSDAGDVGFEHRVWGLAAEFEKLNPYDVAPLLKVESIGDLFYGVSAKRYCLYDLDEEGIPIMRKVSGHGVGYLASPRDPWPMPCELDAPGWQVEVWRRIVWATAPGFAGLPGFNTTALMHYVVSRPSIAAWVKLRPFTFLSILLGRSKYSGAVGWHEIRPIAPFTRSPQEAEGLAIDRLTGKPLGTDVALLATYEEALADYHVHPESKFNPNPHATSFLPRVHVVPDGFTFIGKEADLVDERSVFGSKDVNASVAYGTIDAAASSWRRVFSGVPLSELERITGHDKSYLSRVLNGKRDLTPVLREKFQRAARELVQC